MLITKNNPVGVDVPIQKLQEHLHNRLLALWGIETGQYRSYGRCYRNRLDYGYVAENYEGNNEYKEVYWDDSYSAVSFFGIGTAVAHDKIKEKADVHLVYFVNIAKIKAGIAHRADEEVHRDLLNLIGEGLHGLVYAGLDTGVDNALREYSGSRRDKRMVAVDMHPAHCFRLNFSLLYSKNIC